MSVPSTSPHDCTEMSAWYVDVGFCCFTARYKLVWILLHTGFTGKTCLQAVSHSSELILLTMSYTCSLSSYIDMNDAGCLGPDVSRYGPFYSVCQVC